MFPSCNMVHDFRVKAPHLDRERESKRSGAIFTLEMKQYRVSGDKPEDKTSGFIPGACSLPVPSRLIWNQGQQQSLCCRQAAAKQQQQRSGNDKLFISWTVITPLLWLLMRVGGCVWKLGHPLHFTRTALM